MKARLERYVIRPDLELRRLRRSDAAALFACVDRNRSYLRAWLPWLDMSADASDMMGFIESSLAGYQSGGCFRLAMMVDGELAGCVAIEDIEPAHRCAKIGYWLDARQQGKGLMSDAVRFLMRHAFEERGLHLLELRAAVDNAPSRAVATRVGMKLDGVLRQREWLYDHYVDLAVYSVLAPEWRALSGA